MPKAKKLPSGNWRVQLYTGKVDGKRQYRSFTAPTKRAAECLAAEYAAGKRMDRAQGSALTLKEAINAYIDLKSHILSPSTLRGVPDYTGPRFSSAAGAAIVRSGGTRCDPAANESECHPLPRQVPAQSAGASLCRHGAKRMPHAAGLFTAAGKAANPGTDAGGDPSDPACALWRSH